MLYSLGKRLGFQSILFEGEKPLPKKPLIDVKRFVLDPEPVIGNDEDRRLIASGPQHVAHRFIEMCPETTD